MKNIACKVAENVAFQLGVLEMKRFFNNMPQVALDKKSNFDFMEREIGLGKFLPSTIINRFLYFLSTFWLLLRAHFVVEKFQISNNENYNWEGQRMEILLISFVVSIVLIDAGSECSFSRKNEQYNMIFCIIFLSNLLNPVESIT